MTVKDRINEKTSNMVEKISYNTEIGSFARDIVSSVAIELVKEEDDFESALYSKFITNATGTDLDVWCEDNNIKRNLATFATGEVTITGVNGTLIKKGYKVTSSATNVVYEILEAKTINNFSTKVMVKALSSGIIGNAEIGTINKFFEPYEGLSKVENEEQISNAKDIETDEELRKRALNLIQKPRISWNQYVFEDKAREVAEVDKAHCVPRGRGRGTVDIIITQKGRDEVEGSLLTNVREHIDYQIISDVDIKVIGAQIELLTVQIAGELSSDFDMESAGIRLKELINAFLFEQIFEDKISYFDLVEVVQHSGTFQRIRSILLNGTQQDFITDVTKLYRIDEISMNITK